jgi:hypothetical protein
MLYKNYKICFTYTHIMQPRDFVLLRVRSDITLEIDVIILLNGVRVERVA